MQLKKLGKIRLDLFQKVEFDPESAETMLLVLLCAAAFGISFFSSGKILFDYRLGAKQSAPGSKSDGIIAEKVLAAESQKSEDAEVSKNNYFAEEMKVSNTMSGAADSVKSLAIRTARAKKISRARAAEAAASSRAGAPSLYQESGWKKGLRKEKRQAARKQKKRQAAYGYGMLSRSGRMAQSALLLYSRAAFANAQTALRRYVKNSWRKKGAARKMFVTAISLKYRYSSFYLFGFISDNL